MKAEIKLNDFPEPKIKLPRLMIMEIINAECAIVLQTNRWREDGDFVFCGLILYSNCSEFEAGESLQSHTEDAWEEFTHTLVLSNER